MAAIPRAADRSGSFAITPRQRAAYEVAVCRAKKSYSYSSAIRVRDRLRYKHEGKTINVYRCPRCSRWHLTSNEEPSCSRP